MPRKEGEKIDRASVSRNRDKLINSIIYFVRRTRHCHTLKLFKLLNFLDFEHCRQTGFGVTGLQYKAWRDGPAPSEFWHELDSPGRDLADAVAIQTVRDDVTGEVRRRDFRPRRAFDSSHFTPRELEIMETLAEFFRDLRAEDMSVFSHARELPWVKIYRGGQGDGHIIPYELALDSQPVLPTFPSIDREEFEHRRRLFAGINNPTD